MNPPPRRLVPSGVDWIGEMPEGWKSLKVKYLATEGGTLFMDGDWINSDIIEDDGVRYLTSGNVGVGKYKRQGSGYISQTTFDELHCLKALPGDLMISRLNEPLGRACIIPDDEPFYVIAVDNVILRQDACHDKKVFDVLYVIRSICHISFHDCVRVNYATHKSHRSGKIGIAHPSLARAAGDCGQVGR